VRIGSVHIVLPNSLFTNDTGGDEHMSCSDLGPSAPPTSTWEAGFLGRGAADMRVSAVGFDSMLSAPRTTQHAGCGHPGLQMHFPAEFLAAMETSVGKSSSHIFVKKKKKKEHFYKMPGFSCNHTYFVAIRMPKENFVLNSSISSSLWGCYLTKSNSLCCSKF
jgi:hypothetical protein